jgi:hypothetical protein
MSDVFANGTISPVSTSMVGGNPSTPGTGYDQRFTVTGSWVEGDQITIDLTTNDIVTQIGAGNASGVQASYVFTFNNKVYALSGSTTYFSSVGNPLVWNNPTDPTAGFITMSNYYASSEQLQAMAPYQGRLAFISRRDVLIWAVDPDTANYALIQTLTNIGTFAPLSVQPVGDMDVYMLYDAGIRSVRVRDASNNAIVAGVGEPIDQTIQSVLVTLTAVQQSASCGIVEPSANRYWLFVPNPSDPDNGVGKIYVFSYFPQSQIAAWSTYSPTYSSPVASPGTAYTNYDLQYTGLTVGAKYAWLPGQNEIRLVNGSQTFTSENIFTATATTATVTGTGATASYTGSLSQIIAFTPVQFCIYQGQVWVRDSNSNFYQYGGADNNTYDACGLTFDIPYLDTGTPGTSKYFKGIDAAFEGTWQLGFSNDYVADTYANIYNGTESSFQLGNIPVRRHGTHFSVQATEVSNGYARFSSMLVYFEQGAEKNS